MKKPEFITFTGIDDRTDLDRADLIASIYPIEWGVLFSADNRDARFPCIQAAKEIMDIAGNKSAHLCGLLAREAQLNLVKTDIPLKQCNRVQINGLILGAQQALTMLKDRYGVDLVFQERNEFSEFSQNYFHQLFDCSGGRGQFPEQVPPHPDDDRLVGYAGGMGPETVTDYLAMIEGDGPFWIDMEGQVRTNGWFDLDKVERVCQLVYE